MKKSFFFISIAVLSIILLVSCNDGQDGLFKHAMNSKKVSEVTIQAILEVKPGEITFLSKEKGVVKTSYTISDSVVTKGDETNLIKKTTENNFADAALTYVFTTPYYYVVTLDPTLTNNGKLKKYNSSGVAQPFSDSRVFKKVTSNGYGVDKDSKIYKIPDASAINSGTGSIIATSDSEILYSDKVGETVSYKINSSNTTTVGTLGTDVTPVSFAKLGTDYIVLGSNGKVYKADGTTITFNDSATVSADSAVSFTYTVSSTDHVVFKVSEGFIDVTSTGASLSTSSWATALASSVITDTRTARSNVFVATEENGIYLIDFSATTPEAVCVY